MSGEAMPTGRERPGEHWNARLIREQAEAARKPDALVFCADDTCLGCPGCTPPGSRDNHTPEDPAESIGYRPACRYPSRNCGDGRGCQMDDCPKCGAES